MKISIIIPTLNEAGGIAPLLNYLKETFPDAELIVSDGGSSDGTAEIAGTLAKVIQSARGRGVQMNSGVKIAAGDVLWFVHADCRPHPDSIQSIHTVLNDPSIVGGAFEYGLDHPHSFFRFTEWVSNKKNHILKLIFGDMGIFVWRNVFQKMGGYAEIPLMEDVDFCKRLKHRGRIVILPEHIQTSTRRWEQEGWVRNVIRNWALQAGYAMGVAPERLNRYYSFK